MAITSMFVLQSASSFIILFTVGCDTHRSYCCWERKTKWTNLDNFWLENNCFLWRMEHLLFYFSIMFSRVHGSPLLFLCIASWLPASFLPRSFFGLHQSFDFLCNGIGYINIKKTITKTTKTQMAHYKQIFYRKWQPGRRMVSAHFHRKSFSGTIKKNYNY